MALTLYYHPLSSYCHKVLIALYENETPFTAELVNLGDRNASAAFFAMWPVGKIPVLRDEDNAIPETSIIIEYLDRFHPGARPLLPFDEGDKLDARLWDRFFDLYVHTPMQRIVGDRLRGEGRGDAHAVNEARTLLATAYAMLEQRMAERTWAAGGDFSIADCAAAPALFYAECVAPFTRAHPALAAYFERLLERPSYQRVLEEARPFFQYFPFKENLAPRFLG